MIHQAYAYVVRECDGQKQLLVFEQSNEPDIVRIPAGVVAYDEDWAEAVLRQVAAQTGLQHASIYRFVTSDYEEDNNMRINRHFYLLKAEDVQSHWHYTMKQFDDVSAQCYWLAEKDIAALHHSMADYAYLAFQ